MLDVSDSHRAETALRDRNEALSEASEIKSRFLSNMGYELRTPLTSIGGFAEMLKAGIAGDLPDQAVDYVDAIHEASARLSAQIEAIMDFSQSEAGALPIAKKKQAIAPLLEAVAADGRGAASVAGVALRTDIKPSLGDAPCDARRLSQAVALIIDNAVRYNKRGANGGGEVLLYADGTQGGARIIVSDNGPGMDARTQARVFDGFARSASDGAKGGPKAGGTKAGGLGLPLARKLVEAHGGTLELVSEVGQGTMLTIVIPRK
jgi:signal transduction histidine kinase